ncbi:MAG: hypothetical protein C5B51_10930 [Terriglobia bacterium]|nr:MAG: hypothetical protein C5B51_10930 [Terriglobia bacterium]
MRITTGNVAGALCLSLIAVGGLWATSSTTSQEFRQSYMLAPSGRVMIENPYGDVRISAWDRDEVRIEATKSASDARRLDDARIVVDSSSDRLSIRTQYAGADAELPATVEYRITVPRKANLDNVKLVNGGLSISGLAGAVRATSVNGNIKAEKLEGMADLSTVNGQVEADFHRISPSQPISLRSVNGPIVLSIPSDSGAQLIARNLSGGIQTDFDPEVEPGGHRIRAVLKGGGAQIDLQNVNGGISVHSTWNRRRERPGL